MRISTNQIRNTGLNAILDQQAGLLKTQNQIATQRRVAVPSDDPVAASVIFNLEQQIGLSKRWEQNAKNVEGVAQQEETTLKSGYNTLLRMRELLLQGGDGSLGGSERQSLANEMQIRLGELVGLANTQVNGSEYLFSGAKSSAKPIVVDAAGNYTYQGDQGQRKVDVGASVQIAVSDSGYDVFFNILNGNGAFIAQSDAANTGTGRVSPGSVFDRAAYVPDNYRIDFSVSGSGQTQYEVFNSAAVSVTGGPVNYTDGSAIQFNGISVTVSGAPAAGDRFTVDSSTRQDLFTTVQQGINALRLPTSSGAEKAQFQNKLSVAIQNLDQGMEKLNQVQARIGARLNIIDSQKQVNQDFQLTSTISLSKLRDVDMAKAISDLTLQRSGLEAAQASFARIQNLSLFNFLR